MSRQRTKPLISAERARELFTYDSETGVFTRRKGSRGHRAGREEGTVDPKGYRRLCADGALYLAHRLAWLYVYGRWPTDQIDHIDHNPSNNRIANLRECTNAENRQNIRPEGYGVSGYLGVKFHKKNNNWVAKITLGPTAVYLGSFDTPEAASEAYLTAKKELHYFAAGKGSKLEQVNVQGR